MADLPSSFFKFIPSRFKHSISMPSSFWTRLKGDQRRSNAILRRGNRQWRVEISDGGVFGNGWRDFVTDNGIEEFDFIVFKHQGRMVFEFLVFDQSSCERPYPKLSHKMDKEEEEELESIHTHGSKKLKKHKGNVDFEFNDTHCFQVKMTPSYIKFSILNLPVKFTKSNQWIAKKKRTQVIIKDERGRTWPVTLIYHKRQVVLYGWHIISMKNHQKIRDICMFQLVKYGEVPVFNLSILGSKSINSHKMPTYARNVGLIRCGEDGCPYFLGKLTSSSIERRWLYIPIKFARKNRLIKNGEMILKNVEDERSWVVEFKNYRKNYRCRKDNPYITRGWEEFRVAYGLKEGDRFKFKIMDNVGEHVVVNFQKIVTS